MTDNSNQANDANLRRTFLKLCAGSGLAAASITGWSAEQTASDLNPSNQHPMIIDALGDITNENSTEALQTGPDQGIDARALADAKASGLCAFNHTLGYVFGEQEPFEFSIREIAIWDALIRRHADSLCKVYTVDDIRRAKAQGKVGVIYGFQNAAMMGNDASRVAIFANLGVKVIQLTYNPRNQIGDGSMVKENHGLTEFGRNVVHELNQNKVMVDLSHSAEQTCLDAVAVSKQPIIISHTGCRSVTDLPRNKTDRELKLVAERGGFVGIYFMPFLALGRQPMAADLIAHIEHAIQVCGEDHVGIGTDGSVPQIDDMPAYMDTLKKEVEQRRATGIGAAGERADIVKFLPDLVGVNKFHRLAELLEQRGHSSARIEKILGLNFLRVAQNIW
jgi:membrane dipeptidase